VSHDLFHVLFSSQAIFIQNQNSDAGPTVIIIDHFDDLMELSDAKSVIKGLCRDAFAKKTYKIILCITGCKEALEVLNWNGGDKIRIASTAGCGKWNASGIMKIAALEPGIELLTDEQTQQRAEIIRLGVECGSPLLFQEMLHTES
jgi:hypothetical protein